MLQKCSLSLKRELWVWGCISWLSVSVRNTWHKGQGYSSAVQRITCLVGTRSWVRFSVQKKKENRNTWHSLQKFVSGHSSRGCSPWRIVPITFGHPQHGISSLWNKTTHTLFAEKKGREKGWEFQHLLEGDACISQKTSDEAPSLRDVTASQQQ